MIRKKPRASITDRERIAWQLRYVRGWTLRRIARHQGVTESAISQRLRRLEERSAGPLGTGRHVRKTRVKTISLSYVQNI